MLREYTCIMCPQGCDIEVEIHEGTLVHIQGNQCPKGKAYVTQEVLSPMRNIASSVRVIGGKMPLASVRLSGMIPKDKIFAVMQEIRGVCVEAPVREGDVIIENVLGLGVNVMATRDVENN